MSSDGSSHAQAQQAQDAPFLLEHVCGACVGRGRWRSTSTAGPGGAERGYCRGCRHRLGSGDGGGAGGGGGRNRGAGADPVGRVMVTPPERQNCWAKASVAVVDDGGG